MHKVDLSSSSYDDLKSFVLQWETVFLCSFRISSPIKYTSPMILPPPDVQAPSPPSGQEAYYGSSNSDVIRLSTFKPTEYQNQQPRPDNCPPLPPSGGQQQLCWTNQLYDSFNGSEMTATADAEGSCHDFARPPSIYKDLQPAPLPPPHHQRSGPNVNNKPNTR